jgi:crossover junction endodeoxyribonuclease RuvC
MIISIDPGVSGAIAVLRDDGDLIDVIDMPTSAKTRGKGNEVNAVLLGDYLRSVILNSGEIVRVAIEAVGAMPGQGVTSMFGFGRSLGVVEGVAAAFSLPVEYVTPQRWKKLHGLTGKDKDASRTLVLQKYPNHSDLFSRKKDNGRADAVLIGLVVA